MKRTAGLNNAHVHGVRATTPIRITHAPITITVGIVASNSPARQRR